MFGLDSWAGSMLECLAVLEGNLVLMQLTCRIKLQQLSL
jgi:hypothetical protein